MDTVTSLPSFSSIISLIDWVIRRKNQILVPFAGRFWPRWITPNMITSFRILLALAIIPMLFDYQKWHILVLVFFILGVFSDLWDGVTAEAFNSKSRLGSIIDPLADKLLFLPSALFILKDNPALLSFIIFTEGVLVIIAALAVILGVDGRSNRFGKCKFPAQSGGAIIFLVIGSNPLTIVMFWLSAALGSLSIAGHIRPFGGKRKGGKE